MKVKFVPQNIELEIAPNQTVLQLAHENGIKIKSVCNGMPSCAECRVRLVDGEYNVLPPSSKELSLIGTGYFIDQRRLACQLLCFGDVTVDLSEQIERENATRRPQGVYRKDAQQESQAVIGNLLEQEADLVKSIGVNREDIREAIGQREDLITMAIDEKVPAKHPGPNLSSDKGDGRGPRRRSRRRRRR